MSEPAERFGEDGAALLAALDVVFAGQFLGMTGALFGRTEKGLAFFVVPGDPSVYYFLRADGQAMIGRMNHGTLQVADVAIGKVPVWRDAWPGLSFN